MNWKLSIPVDKFDGSIQFSIRLVVCPPPIWDIQRPFGYEKMYLSLCEVVDNPFYRMCSILEKPYFFMFLPYILSWLCLDWFQFQQLCLCFITGVIRRWDTHVRGHREGAAAADKRPTWAAGWPPSGRGENYMHDPQIDHSKQDTSEQCWVNFGPVSQRVYHH